MVRFSVLVIFAIRTLLIAFIGAWGGSATEGLTAQLDYTSQPAFEEERGFPRGNFQEPSPSSTIEDYEFGKRPDQNETPFYPGVSVLPIDTKVQTKPSGGKVLNHPFRCTRQFIYKGKTLDCDSAVARDGEGLRSIMKDSPLALEKLDNYQETRRRTLYTAYTGTAGLLLIATNGLTARLFGDSSPEGQATRQSYQKNIRFAGIGMLLGSIAVGTLSFYHNEKRLESAVLKFNEDFPDRPIQIGIEKKF